MAPDLVRDSAFGHIIRKISKNRWFQYPEERDVSISSKYYNVEKTRNICRYGQTTVPEDRSTKSDDSEKDPEKPPADRAPGSDTTLANQESSSKNVVGAPVDAERGRDITVVDWDGPNDPEVGRPLVWQCRLT